MRKEIVLNKNKIGLITHQDLDGFGCYEVLRRFLNVDIPFKHSFNPDSLKTTSLIDELMLEKPDIKTIFITDRELSVKDAEYINRKYNVSIVHIDHHLNTKHYNLDYIIGFYGERNSDDNKSASELCVDFCEMFLLDYIDIKPMDWFYIKEAMVLVGDWDTFRWKSFTDGTRVMKVKGIMAIEKLYGSETIFEKLIECSKDGYMDINSKNFVAFSIETYNKYKNNLEEEYSKVIKSKIVFSKNDKSVAIIKNPSTLYFSLIANRFFEENEETVVIAIYPSGLISCRGNNFRNKINLQTLMSNTPGGGGGHFNAAGGKLFKTINEDKTDWDTEEEYHESLSHLIKFLEDIL